jgi:hypothetical protein
MAPETAAEIKICTVPDCTEPRADQSDDATNRHCRAHKNEAQKNWLRSKEAREKAEYFRNGVITLREHLATQFGKYTIQRFSGPQIADIIRRAELPQ